ncbi:DUF1007 family protein [Providencia sneebia]|uniref:ABC transporter substrate-binding protein n=1 Tax=Providencia sneebia DSM 19967 TaxID=1141660 RepID=K8WF23_9GAMM|nr:DUF1007 family protein [Providencia sneebia]EKT58521.1 hypothetical protein OO7_07384 [Providencia sneebia DSM 19967]
MKPKLLTLLFCLFASVKSFSHPHSFIDMQVLPEIEQHQYQGLTFTWKMDPMTSADIAYELKNKKESDPEWKKQAATVMANILSQDYFTEFYSQGHKVRFKKLPSHYQLQREGLQLIFTFTVPFESPFPINGSDIEFLTYDPTFFVSMTYPDNKAILHPKELEEICNIKLLEPDVTEALRTYADSLDIDETAEEDTTLGLQFAQRVKIQCQ